jgi:hypothetical protein
MKARAAKWLAWLMVATFTVAVIFSTRFSMLQGDFDLTEGVSLWLAFGVFTAVGSLVVARRPGNPLGWAFAAVGLLAATGELASQYSWYAYVRESRALPGAIAAAWYANWSWFPTLFLAVWFPLLFFPTGRPLSARWRPLVWVAGMSVVALTLLGVLDPSLAVPQDGSVANPVGIAGMPEAESSSTGAALTGLLLMTLVAALVHLVTRFRRSRGEERQQLKWFTFAGVLMVLTFAAEEVTALSLPDLVFGLLIGLVPLCAGIAILKYRLYDIDLIINRTLVYGALTGVLGSAYVGIVAVGGTVFRGSEIVTAGATLAVAGLFRPLRRWIQGFIDRRFYRRKYDAGRILESFSARLRDEVDLETLTSELLEVVGNAMQPAHASIWLRHRYE